MSISPPFTAGRCIRRSAASYTTHSVMMSSAWPLMNAVERLVTAVSVGALHARRPTADADRNHCEHERGRVGQHIAASARSAIELAK